mmetsp:Transcript_32017/g.72123  ORF Transcript_32017/g.72123 Transcript_32017/m.72123 type:complete len:189 (-) Transcript_32017:87-653(-)|eukprot:CAMPEP_0172651896 /NCGR_PEP_ID=MMETSP1068-20121228/243043_1 /TAXON_ID=35684 /ORGANISM="Pseudopedinella elastica, Strain CCMP716" /LENGTH=188 /DNA_ID=CAMNT_0013466299 /DNA_START=83 /DNA_END=649 /DNA_ORIENTATION=-
MTSVKAAIEAWEAKTGQVAAEATKVELYCQIPLIKKLDPAAFGVLANCEHLALSTNNIDKLVSFGEMPKLRILSVGRNLLKKLEKLEDVSGTLEELWISYNALKTMDEINVLENLQVLYISNNLIADFGELDKLAGLAKFREILLVGNPCYEGLDEHARRVEVLRHLPNLGKIDGLMVTNAERSEASG